MEAQAASAVPDILAAGLRCVFCGINPGRRSSAAGCHFANPRNDFWRLLADAGLTPRLARSERAVGPARARLRPHECRLPDDEGRAATCGAGDFAGSAERLERLAVELEPGTIAFVGKSSYQGAFGVPRIELGLQERRLGATTLFVLPSTSPANAAVPYEERLAWFTRLADHLGR